MIFLPNDILAFKFKFFPKNFFVKFFSIFFSNFFIFQIFNEIEKKNTKNFHILSRWDDLKYSSIFHFSIIFPLKKINVIVFAKNSTNELKFKKIDDYSGNERFLFDLKNLKNTKNGHFIKNFELKKTWLILGSYRLNEIISSFKHLGIFFPSSYKKKNPLIRFSFKQNFGIKKNKEKDVGKNLIFKGYFCHGRKDLFNLFFFFFGLNPIMKGFLNNIKSNWVHFGELSFSFLNRGKFLKKFLKKKHFEITNLSFRKNSFFLYEEINKFGTEIYEKYKQIFFWIENKINELYVQEKNISEFLMNFEETDGLAKFEKKNSRFGLLLFRINKIDDFRDFNFSIKNKFHRNFWTRKIIFLSQKFSVIIFNSINFSFFHKKKDVEKTIESSIKKKNYLTEKDFNFSKIPSLNFFSPENTYVRFEAQKLISNLNQSRISGKSNKYDKFN